MPPNKLAHIYMHAQGHNLLTHLTCRREAANVQVKSKPAQSSFYHMMFVLGSRVAA